MERYTYSYSQWIFDIAELAKYTPDDRRAYNSSLKYYRDIKNVVDTAFEEGRDMERFAIARRMKEVGLPTAEIATFTGLPPAEIERL